MKNRLTLLALLSSAAACQQHLPPTSSTATAEPAREAVDTAAVVPADTRLLHWLEQTTDFSPLLQTVQAEAGRGYSHAQNGFFGPTPYRIEMALTQVVRDARHPALYHVRGLSRYKKIITPFAGEFTIDKLSEQPYYTAREVAEYRRKFGHTLTNDPGLFNAQGRFELREDSTHRGSGVFRGQLTINWKRSKTGELELEWRGRSSDIISAGGGVRYDGSWTGYKTHKTYAVRWMENVLDEAEEIMPKFNIGEREVVINPKYARLGWPEYWENDEWWADSPKPSLNL